MKHMATDLERRRLVLAGIGGCATASLGACGGGGGGGMGGPMPGMGATGPPAPSSASAAVPLGQPWRELPRLANSATAARSFVATLTAAPAMQAFVPGRATPVLAYNGSTPGPLIEIDEGSSVQITLANGLAADTTLHWHGLPVPADQDGNPMDPVAPGAQRVYRFTLGAGSAGSHWVHPHAHRTTHEQVYRGLAAPLVVRSAADPLAGLRERVVFVTDLKLDSESRIADNDAFDASAGREGDLLLVNGQRQPRDGIAPGSSERWRIWNATNARYLLLALDGAAMQLVALDGQWLAAPRAVSTLLLAPAQRADIVVRAPAVPGQRVALRTLPYDRGMGIAPRPGETLFEVLTGDEATAAAFALPAALPAPSPLPLPARTQDIMLGDMGMMAMMGMMAGPMGMHGAFTINGRTFDPARDDLVARVGIVEDWLVHNAGTMDHPLHVHGTAFQLVASSRGDIGGDPRLGAFIDTINTRPGETLRLRIAFDAPGRRPLHCHILEHEDQGMMAIVNVLA